jgi:hypothetical protein
MAKQPEFALIYAPVVRDHLRFIADKHHSLIRSEIESQLRHEPHRETRNRKPLKRPIIEGADWELRLGPDNRFRVFYQVFVKTGQVHILAIGIKDRSRLLIGGEEFNE